MLTVTHFLFHYYSWNKVLSFIWTVESGPSIALVAGKLRDKERNVIKERFAVSFFGTIYFDI